MKDLRPISLCNMVYKKVSKLIANRLKKCLSKCVLEEQSAFVEGRSFLDNAMLAIEIIHALKRKTRGNKSHLALKIDISKAYDRMDWGFLQGILGKMGFASKSIHWIMMCVISVPYSKHQFQEINLNKSEMFFIHNISRPAQEDLANLMGMCHVLGTRSYSGLPSLIGRSKKGKFSFIKDRIWKMINSWKGRSLSKVGKDVMIKSVLQSIPSYITSVYIIPNGVVKDIEKMLNSFWWGGGGNNKGIRWMAWDKLTCTKMEV
ncbi:uncharacterized protein LOC131646083 [Vicia villosa]|uniref:uncharacterized protein LOC131646083 n=1 Tax=Vicia villosa TaxID=3911 RepID=UPI00273B5EF0|nr:uncharacterized protein LOC131646083 [Vicia villosa]